VENDDASVGGETRVVVGDAVAAADGVDDIGAQLRDGDAGPFGRIGAESFLFLAELTGRAGDPRLAAAGAAAVAFAEGIAVPQVGLDGRRADADGVGIARVPGGTWQRQTFPTPFPPPPEAGLPPAKTAVLSRTRSVRRPTQQVQRTDINRFMIPSRYGWI
jgi:hypothetical protein